MTLFGLHAAPPVHIDICIWPVNCQGPLAQQQRVAALPKPSSLRAHQPRVLVPSGDARCNRAGPAGWRQHDGFTREATQASAFVLYEYDPVCLKTPMSVI
jgi:hypothetical protein